MRCRSFGIGLLALLATGCASAPKPVAPVTPLAGPKAEVATTAYTQALRCLAQHVRSQSFPPPRAAVGLITDMTGAQDPANGRKLTQGATLMAITALSEAGVRLVERYDMGVLQVEMDYARNGLVRDSQQVIRSVRNGEIEGADVYLIGGISEFNPNIRSRGVEGFAGGTNSRSTSLTLGGSDYVVDVALDLRLVDARSSEVLAVRSLRKQVVGREIRAGVFAFLDGSVVDIGGGQRAMEPVQTAVRTMVDQIVYEFMASLYGLSADACLPREPVSVADARGRLSPSLESSPASSAAASPASGQAVVQPGAPARRERARFGYGARAASPAGQGAAAQGSVGSVQGAAMTAPVAPPVAAASSAAAAISAASARRTRTTAVLRTFTAAEGSR